MELGYSVEDGCLEFDFLLLDRSEFLAEPSEFVYLNVHGQQEKIELPSGSIAYTVCQVPIVLQTSDEPCIEVYLSDGSIQRIDGYSLDPVNSKYIFQRDGVVYHLVVSMTQNK
jgi:hypothetical protein